MSWFIVSTRTHLMGDPGEKVYAVEADSKEQAILRALDDRPGSWYDFGCCPVVDEAAIPLFRNVLPKEESNV